MDAPLKVGWMQTQIFMMFETGPLLYLFAKYFSISVSCFHTSWEKLAMPALESNRYILLLTSEYMTIVGSSRALQEHRFRFREQDWMDAAAA